MLRVCRRYAKRHLWTVQWTRDQDRLARDTEQSLWYYRQLDSARAGSSTSNRQ